MWFELTLGLGGHLGSFGALCKRTAGATPVKVINLTVKSLTLLKLCDQVESVMTPLAQQGTRQEVASFTKPYQRIGLFAPKIRLMRPMAPEFEWPVFWPSRRYSDGQLRRS